MRTKCKYENDWNFCVVKGGELVLVGENFDTSLALGHAVLLLLSELGGRQLGFLLGRVDLVAHGVEAFFFFTFFL